MYLGSIVEYGKTDELFSAPMHPYTKALFSAIPMPDPDIKTNRVILEGSLPSPVNPPSGCKFHTRCPSARPECAEQVQEYREAKPGHFVACSFA
jgi:peptide/nickel transport system ATP-binding protein